MERLKHKRAARRAQVTKLVKEAVELRSDQTVSTTSLKGLLTRLLANQGDLKKINEEIEPLIKEDDFAAEYQAVIDYEEQSANAIGEVQARLDELQLMERPSTAATPLQAAPSTTASQPSHGGIKLPKLQPDTFTGELTKWLTFWEQFRTAVHENGRLSKIEKFQYLRTLLKGDAASVIRGLQATESCYDDAVDILKQRFGDTARIEREYLTKLRKLPLVKSTCDLSGLRLLYDLVQANMRGLSALGVPITSYASMMVDILLSSLPTDMVVEYQRMAKYGTKMLEDNGVDQDGSALDRSESNTGIEAKEQKELSRVLRFVRVEIESRELSGLKARYDSQTGPRNPIGSRNRKVPTGAVLHGAVGVDTKCVFCGASDHETATCPADFPMPEKLEKLTREMCCFRCTKRGHRSKDCRMKMPCTHCWRRHAPSVCGTSKETTPKTTVNEVVTTTNVTAANDVPKQQNTEVLLQTFRAWASSDKEGALVRGIIDGGSQRTFIRDDIARKLKLRVIRETTLQLNTFANETASKRVRRCKVVEVRLRSQYHPKEYVVQATTIDFICEDLAETPVNDDFVKAIRHTGSFIADDMLVPGVKHEGGIGLLIGCDELWKLLTGDVRRCENNEKLVAIETVFGWTFQGPSSVSGYCAERSTTAVCVLRAGVGTLTEDDILTKFWELESLGITGDASSKTDHDKAVLEEFERNIRMTAGRYEVALPWKAHMSALENNYEIAKDRLWSLVRRLDRDGFRAQYGEAIRSYINKGHAEKVTKDDNSFNTRYYMPRRAVIRNTSETTKVRIVFDASSHSKGMTSLNDHLEKGPK
ncbi:uncharacterized protein LOC135384272 [Ornithodoros turicata]|uniref:uncharacterized protein LOC135384272 n=1 Tax=Ornithodoros turicata TaxID=34597 RepID=UPI00313A19C1